MRRVFMTLDAALMSFCFVVAAFFFLEGSPGELTTAIIVFESDISYLLFGPDICDSFVCYSDLNILPNAESRTSIKKKIDFLGTFPNVTSCEQACLKHKVLVIPTLPS